MSLVSLQPRFAAWRLAGPAAGAAARGAPFLFTLYLKYLELFVIHAICRWCVASAVLITAIFVLSVARGAAAEAAR